MNGYNSLSAAFMEAHWARRDNRCTRQGGWRSIPPRLAVPAGIDPARPVPLVMSEEEAALLHKERKAKGGDSDARQAFR